MHQHHNEVKEEQQIQVQQETETVPRDLGLRGGGIFWKVSHYLNFKWYQNKKKKSSLLVEKTESVKVVKHTRALFMKEATRTGANE